jgi:hypothetical protein
VALLDERDVSDVDSVKVLHYRNIFLGFVGVMDNPAVKPLQTQFMWSRDGLAWERLPDRPPFIANGSPGEWDEGWVAVTALIPDGDRIRIYYSACNLPQSEDLLPRVRGTGLAFIQRDRFVGQQAGPEGGYLLTREFVLEGDRLEINCRTQVARPPCQEMAGLIKAEILERPATTQGEPKPVSGFAMEDCDPVAVRDDLQLVLTWKGSSDLSALRGRSVYIRFFIRNATLYTFRIAAATPDKPEASEMSLF